MNVEVGDEEFRFYPGADISNYVHRIFLPDYVAVDSLTIKNVDSFEYSAVLKKIVVHYIDE